MQTLQMMPRYDGASHTHSIGQRLSEGQQKSVTSIKVGKLEAKTKSLDSTSEEPRCYDRWPRCLFFRKSKPQQSWNGFQFCAANAPSGWKYLYVQPASAKVLTATSILI